MSPLFDMHTHGDGQEAGTIGIFNVLAGFDKAYARTPVSMGLHPWHLSEGDIERDFQALEAAASQPVVLAIGECGLDRVCDTPMPLQEQAFRRQLALAERLRKPVVIHCVRAFEEVIRILRETRVTVPVIFHGFRKDAATAGRILAAGHRLSFGKALSDARISGIFRSVPHGRVFLETDDADATIAEVYDLAARATGTDIEVLTERLWADALSVFGKSLNEYA
ncbi:MAG: TatD family deoxyribonuclease [Chitinophagia bacterium]|nr:TatD family deoxyribonuclease [Chitinophagia bacterium]